MTCRYRHPHRWRGQNANLIRTVVAATRCRCHPQPLESPGREPNSNQSGRDPLPTPPAAVGEPRTTVSLLPPLLTPSPMRIQLHYRHCHLHVAATLTVRLLVSTNFFLFFSPFHYVVMNYGIVVSVKKEGYRFVLTYLVLLLLLVSIWCCCFFCKLILILYHSLEDFLVWVKHWVRVVTLWRCRRIIAIGNYSISNSVKSENSTTYKVSLLTPMVKEKPIS